MHPPKRREADKEDTTTAIIRSGAMATAAFLVFGALSFLGTFGVGLNASVAKLREDVAVMQERQTFIEPWFVDEIKKMHENIKDLRGDIKELSNEIKSRRP